MEEGGGTRTTVNKTGGRMSLHAILRDPECKGNIQCAMWAVVVTLGMLCLMLFGIAWMSTAEKINADVYGAKNSENKTSIGREGQLEDRIIILENQLMGHVHRYFDGKIKEIN